MKVQRFSVGPLDTNCYLITDESTGHSAVLDPGGTNVALSMALNQIGLEQIKYILLTHGHFDHIGGVAEIKEKTGADVVIEQEDSAFPTDGSLNLAIPVLGGNVPGFAIERVVMDEDYFALGNLKVHVIHTPGHTRGSCCYQIDDAIFTGDTLMKMSIGRTDFPTGDFFALQTSLQKLAKLPGDYRIFPGHGEPSTLSFEKSHNPYLGTVSL